MVDYLDDILERISKEMVGKSIAIPGNKPVGKVVKVDYMGAWLEKGGRISYLGIVFYKPVEEFSKNIS